MLSVCVFVQVMHECVCRCYVYLHALHTYARVCLCVWGGYFERCGTEYLPAGLHTLGCMGKQHHRMKAINATKVPTSSMKSSIVCISISNVIKSITVCVRMCVCFGILCAFLFLTGSSPSSTWLIKYTKSSNGVIILQLGSAFFPISRFFSFSYSKCRLVPLLLPLLLRCCLLWFYRLFLAQAQQQ